MTARPIFVERSRPPVSVWALNLIPVVVLTGLPFGGPTVEAIGALLGFLWLIGLAVYVITAAGKRWWVTPYELRVRPVPRAFRMFSRVKERQVPLGEIASVEVRYGQPSEIRKELFGSDGDAATVTRAGCDKSWTAGVVLAWLRSPDAYGPLVWLCTNRPREAHDALTQTIQQATPRPGATT